VELAAARGLLLDEAVPLLTLTGPGGVGKTRLALAIANDVAGAFVAGAVFVDLSPIRDAALVLPVIAQVVGVRQAGEQTLADALAAFLRPRQVLLLLDNCEQVLDAAGDIAGLISACPALQVLATSRAPLKVHGEHLLAIPPLTIPGEMGTEPPDPDLLARIEAVTLFVQRARAADRGFALTARNAAAVAEICRRLDGLPLAIELAAARLRLLSVEALRALLANRLRVLTDGPRDSSARQRTLRDTIAWSYDLLTPGERALFRRLAVFAGSFDLAAAAAIAEAEPLEVLDELMALSDQSLLRQMDGPGDERRLGMLETIREYGLERLQAAGEEVAARDRHAVWCANLVETAWPPRAAAPADESALARLDAAHDDVRAALAWVLGRAEADAALHLAVALTEYWWLRGDFAEGRDWLARALHLPGGAPHLRAAALCSAGSLATAQNDMVAARALATEGLAIAATHGDRLDRLRAHLVLSIAAGGLGDVAQQVTHAEAAHEFAREIGDVYLLAYMTSNLADAIHHSGDIQRASELQEEAVRLVRTRGDRWAEMYTTAAFAAVRHAQGETGRAARLFRRVLELGREIASPWGIVQGLVGLAAIAASVGDAERSACLLGAAEAIREPRGFRLPRDLMELRDDAIGIVRARLGDDGFAAEWDGGRALSLDQAVALGLAATEDEPVAAASLPTSVAATPPAAAPYGISKREREVLALLAQRYSQKEIAATLSVSPHTVHRHIGNLYSKLGATDRRDAVALAARLGLV
jgi:non-specific serine/threonine protein kinase